MGTYFGTDGIRGVYGKDMTLSLAYKLGCALSNFCKNKRVLIGRDTRPSGQVLTFSITEGLTSCGINVLDIGIAPTPVISFLTDKLNCDFGIVISASHNSAEYNGIKIFNRNGYKITEKEELEIEDLFKHSNPVNYDKVGTYKFKPNLIKIYEKKLLKEFQRQNIKIVVDCANGATYKIAKKIFQTLCSNVVFCNRKNNGTKINEHCGALFPEVIATEVLKNQADIGFSFDGDGDRIIVCDKDGKILDGDDILCVISKKMGGDEKYIVGTSMTNKGFENYLAKNNITLLRADVGDKYVAEIMREKDILLGGEPSGHIIIKNFAKTGDAILVACCLLSLLSNTNDISSILDYTKYPQVNINVPVQEKFRILNSEKLTKEMLQIQNKYQNEGRVLVRASGTENKIRIMCEHISKQEAEKDAKLLKEIVETLDETYNNDKSFL